MGIGAYGGAASRQIGDASGTGSITLITDNVSLSDLVSVSNDGSVSIYNRTAGSTIGVGAGAGSLSISDAWLGVIDTNQLTIGRTSAGLVRVDSSYAYDNPTTFVSSTGIDVSSALATLAGSDGSFTFTGPTTIGAEVNTSNSLAGVGSITLGNDSHTLNGDLISDDSNITVNGTSTLSGDVNITTGNTGTVLFTGSISGNAAGHDLSVTAGSGGITFQGAIGSAGVRLGEVSLITQGALSLPVMWLQSLLARTTGGTSDITLNGAVNASGTGNAIILASGNDIHNLGAGITTSAGRYLLYSERPSQDTAGGITANRRYGRTYVSHPPASISESGNLWMYSYAPTLRVTATGTVTLSGVQYTSIYSGLQFGDSVSQVVSGSPEYSTSWTNSSPYGTYPITLSQGNQISRIGYQLVYTQGELSTGPMIDSNDVARIQVITDTGSHGLNMGSVGDNGSYLISAGLLKSSFSLNGDALVGLASPDMLSQSPHGAISSDGMTANARQFGQGCASDSSGGILCRPISRP